MLARTLRALANRIDPIPRKTKGEEWEETLKLLAERRKPMEGQTPKAIYDWRGRCKSCGRQRDGTVSLV